MDLIIKKSLTEEVSFRLKDQIMNGEYITGQKMPVESQLMERFGVGRSTIREAIKSLATGGLLKVCQGKGTFVQDIALLKQAIKLNIPGASFPNIQEVRNVFELQIVKNAAVNRDAKDITLLKATIANYVRGLKTGSEMICIKAHFDFYQALSLSGKNQILGEFYELLHTRLLNDLKSNSRTSQIYQQAKVFYDQLFNSVLEKNPDKAVTWHCKIMKNLYP